MSEKFDAIIVGAGQAGPFVAARLTGAGQTVALIERKLVGGTCVNYGCIPTKTLVASAHTAHLARRGADYGIGTDDHRRHAKSQDAQGQDLDGRPRQGRVMVGGHGGTDLIRGHARFEGPHTVSVDGRLLEAGKVFLNVGARATVPDMPGPSDIDYLTNVGILELDTVPEHLVIIGGSYIGLEFAQMYRRFGAHVTVIEKGPRLAPHEDEDVSDMIREILEAEGIEVVVDAGDVRFAKRRNGFQLVPPDGAHPITGTHLLIAVGRRPNTDDLGLDKAGVETDDHGYIVVDDELRTSVGHVVQRFRDRGRQHRSSRRCSPPRQRPGHHLRAVYRPPAGAGRYDGRRSAQIRPKSIGGQATDDTRRARCRKRGETAVS